MTLITESQSLEVDSCLLATSHTLGGKHGGFGCEEAAPASQSFIHSVPKSLLSAN